MTRRMPYRKLRFSNGYAIYSSRYAQEEMEEIMAYADRHGPRKAARDLHVSRATLDHWRRIARRAPAEAPTLISYEEAYDEPQPPTLPLKDIYKDAIREHLRPGAYLKASPDGIYHDIVSDLGSHNVPNYLVRWTEVELAYVNALAQMRRAA